MKAGHSLAPLSEQCRVKQTSSHVCLTEQKANQKLQEHKIIAF
jgi:hypothetical protein